MKAEKRDLILVLIWPILAALISLLVNANYLLLILIFYGIPSLFLSFKNPGFIKKIALFSLVLGIPITIITDHIVERTGGYFIKDSIFSFRIFQFTSFESILFGILIFYFILMYYEFFLEQHMKDKLYYPEMKYAIIISYALFILFILVFFLNSDILSTRYSFFKIGFIFIFLPVISVLLKFPNLFTKFLKAGVYFLYFTFILEISALKLQIWTFPGEFIGWVNILGIKFPFEELFFWIMLGAIAVLSYYEFFDDDRK